MIGGGRDGGDGGGRDGVERLLAVRATGTLRLFNRAGALGLADVHVAQRLGRLGREDDDRVLLAAALTVRAARGGSVCLSLEDAPLLAAADDGEEVADADLPWPELAAWQDACRRSPLVAEGVDGDPGRPLRWVDGRLYLDRYWRQEQTVRAEVDARLRAAALPVDADALRGALDRVHGPQATGPQATGPQRLAAVVAAVSRLTVLTGGPGTGKTTTVARILAVLASLDDAPRRIALAAPTGKAAARLQEAVRSEVATLPEPDRRRLGELSASTLHRLLGWQPGSTTRFRHDRTNRLPHDVVVVDETSMVSLTLMSRLLEALRPDTRLVLVGDPDQLASVEAGAVLGDLVARPTVGTSTASAVRSLVPELAAEGDAERLDDGIVRLDRVHRFGGRIADLATAVRAGDADETLHVLTGGHPDVEHVAPQDDGGLDLVGLRRDVLAAGADVVAAARAGDAAAALTAAESHRLMVAHRRGPFGVRWWSQQVDSWLDEAGLGPGEAGEWYPGRPLLVTANDRDTGLYNGDTGVVVVEAGLPVAVFGTPDAPRRVAPHRLSAVETVHAMTVHRGQGSQFRAVSLILPPAGSPLLTRELLYTAVTRARERVRVIAWQDAVRVAVQTPVRRASGLRRPLPG